MKLTEKEASTLEIGKLENDIIARETAIARLEQSLSEYKHKVASLEVEKKIQELIRRKEVLKRNRTDFIKPIKERLGIEENESFGFDPDTLEVITKETEG